MEKEKRQRGKSTPLVNFGPELKCRKWNASAMHFSPEVTEAGDCVPFCVIKHCAVITFKLTLVKLLDSSCINLKMRACVSVCKCFKPPLVVYKPMSMMGGEGLSIQYHSLITSHPSPYPGQTSGWVPFHQNTVHSGRQPQLAPLQVSQVHRSFQ